jgi:hypothetical protein
VSAKRRWPISDTGHSHDFQAEPPHPFLPAAGAMPAILAAELQASRSAPTQSGERVTTAVAWQTTRRPEVLELFRKHVYGRAPVGRPADLKFEVFDSAADAMGGKATRNR